MILMHSKNTLPDNDTVSLNLLELIAISGEFPSYLIDRITGSRSYKEAVVTALKRQGFVKTYYKESLRGLRLTYLAKQKLLELNPRRFEFACTRNSDTNHIKGDLPRRQRLHRIAEATVTIQNADMLIFRDEKPDVFSPYFDEDTDIEITTPAFPPRLTAQAFCSSSPPQPLFPGPPRTFIATPHPRSPDTRAPSDPTQLRKRCGST